jgi:hypothetical protein
MKFAVTASTRWAIIRSESSSPPTASPRASTSTSISPPSSTTIFRGTPTGSNNAKDAYSKSIIDTITQSLLLNPDRKISTRRSDRNQIEFNFEDFNEARKLELEVSDKYKKAADRESQRRSIFAQEAIKAGEIEQDLRENDDAIGSPAAVESFVVGSLKTLFGVQIDREKLGYLLFSANLPSAAKALLPTKPTVKVSFESPTPVDHVYLGRNHPLVEQLCQMVLAHSIERNRFRAARAAVLLTSAVLKPTTLLMFRCRNVIEEKRIVGHQLVAEEMLLWGYRGSPEENDHLTLEEARELLANARPDGDLTPERCIRLIEERVAAIPSLRPAFDLLAEQRSQHLVEAHERFSALVEKKRFGVVYPVLPMDVLGLYVLMPVS